MTSIELNLSPITKAQEGQTASPIWPRVSIITVVFNGADFIENTIKQICELSYPNVEYIIVDGGSKDSTLNIIKSHAHRIARWVSEPDQGIYDAMNKGLNLASGEFVWFLNAGDAPAQSDVLNRMFLSGGDCDYYYGDTCLINEAGQMIKTVVAPMALTSMAMLYGMQVSHQSILVRRSLAPLYDLKYSYIADQKWIVDILRETTNGRHVGFTISNYLLGGLSHQRYGHFVLQKMRYSFDELPWFHAAYMSTLHGLQALKFYVGSFLRKCGLR